MDKPNENKGKRTAKPLLDFGEPVEDRSQDIIKVIGVGGGGCNAVSNMYREGIVNVSFAVCNTDTQSLKKSPVPVKIQLGKEGLGAGANPEKGRAEAEASLESIRSLFNDNTKLCFITAGMGGGTGTGSGPVVAKVAKEMGVLTVGIVTIPFYFEKRNKIIKALKGVEEMRKNVDTLLIVNNERICDIFSDSDVPVKDAFKSADRILGDATRSISELITVEGTINLDFRDVQTTMGGGGGAIMAIGRGSGERRVHKAFLDALDSPLLYGSDISKAKNILFNIYTSSEAPLFVRETREIDAFMDELDPSVNVIYGMSDDDTLGQDAKVIILATGLDNEFLPKDKPHDEDDVEFYKRVIAQLYREDIERPRPSKPHEEPAAESVDDVTKPVSDVTSPVSDVTKPVSDATSPASPDSPPKSEKKSGSASFLDRVRNHFATSWKDITKEIYDE